MLNSQLLLENKDICLKERILEITRRLGKKYLLSFVACTVCELLLCDIFWFTKADFSLQEERVLKFNFPRQGKTSLRNF